jgi:DNA-binding GntR family transcriptional regulator
VPQTGDRHGEELERISTVEALVKAIGDRILDGSYEPGAPLREPDLCKHYGVSRHSIRTALQTLAHEGLIRLVTNRGAYVPAFDASDINDLFLLRIILECTAIEHLSPVDDARLEPIRATVDALRAMPESASWGEMRDADMAFHRAIVDSLGSARASRAHASAISESRLLLRQLRLEFEDHDALVRQHEEILQALLDHRPDRAKQLLRDHLLETCANIVDLQARSAEHPSPASDGRAVALPDRHAHDGVQTATPG